MWPLGASTKSEAAAVNKINEVGSLFSRPRSVGVQGREEEQKIPPHSGRLPSPLPSPLSIHSSIPFIIVGSPHCADQDP